MALVAEVAKWILLKVMLELKIMAPLVIRRIKFSAPEVPIVPVQFNKNIALIALPAVYGGSGGSVEMGPVNVLPENVEKVRLLMFVAII